MTYYHWLSIQCYMKSINIDVHNSAASSLILRIYCELFWFKNKIIQVS